MKKYKRILALSLAVLMLMSTFITFPAMALTAAGTVFSGAQSDGTVLAYFDFDDTENWKDGGNAKATVGGGSIDLVQRGNGYAANFVNGEEDWLNITDSNGGSLLTGYNELTISYDFLYSDNSKTTWVYYAAPNTNPQPVGTAEIYISSMISPNEKSLKMERYYNARANNAISGDLTANQWYHIDVVYTNNATVVYVNGTQVSYESSSFKLTDILGTGSIFQIGKGNWGTGEYTTMQLDNFKIVAGARRYTNQLEWLADQLTLPYSTETGKEVYGNITLPATIKEDGLSATVTWETNNSAVVSDKGIVNRPASDTDVTLTATITSGSSTTKRDFTFTVKAKPKEIKEEDYTDYFFAYFTGEAYSDGEQAYFATSQDGLKWENINNNKPSLSSTVGRTGLRDPFIIRSPEGDKFYMLATDANHNKYGWTTFSTSVFIAESTDLVHWTNQRLVDLGKNSQGKGYGFKCVWAPEAFYDSSREEYVVFWASSYGNPVAADAILRIYYATTRDFYTFSDVATYIAYDANNSYIDTTMIENNGTIYRFTKNEGAEGTTNSLGANGKSIFMEKGSSVIETETNKFSIINSDSLNAEHPVEAPSIFKLNKDDSETDTWCLLLDNFSGIGYYPLLTTNLDSGVFEKVSDNRYQMPGAGYRAARHGTPIRITSEEYKTIMANAAENTKTTAEGDITAEFSIDAVNVIDTNANAILIYPNKFAEPDIDDQTKDTHLLNLGEMFPNLTEEDWSKWYAIRIEKRGNKSDGLRYTVLQKGIASAGFGVQKNDSFFLLVKKTSENETLYSKIRDQWPTINSGVINEYVSDGLGDTAEIFINNNLELNDLNGEHGCDSGKPYGKVTFIRRNTFGIEAINTLDTHNDVNTILVNPAQFVDTIKANSGDGTDTYKILRFMFPNPPSGFNWGEWTAVRIEKRGGRYTVLEEGVPVSGDQVGYIGVDTYDSYILLIRTELLSYDTRYKLPTADWPQPITDYTLDGNGDTATFTFLNTDNTYSSADTSGLKSNVSTAASTAYSLDKYYAYVTFAPKNYEQRNGLNGDQGEKADADITPVTDSSIKFSLFDYDGNINFKRGTSQYTEANQRTIAEYFPFKYQLYGLWSNPEYQNIPSRSDNKLYWETEYDKWHFIPGHSTVNKTLNKAGYPVLNLWRTDSNGNSFTTSPELNDEQRSLAYLFGGTNDSSVTKYTPSNTILQKNGTHYTYDCNKNAVDYDKSNSVFRLRNYTERIDATAYGDQTENCDFLPFNYTDGIISGTDQREGSSYAGKSYAYNVRTDKTDYWFGMRMDVDFIQSNGGIIKKENDEKEDMVFKFSGDDDVWVFIDDVLVLDLGGTHGACTGTINFRTGAIEQYEQSNPSYNENTTLKACFEAAGKTSKVKWNSDGTTFADYTEHTMSFFYMERGSGASYCNIDFNLPTPPDKSVAVSKDVVYSNNKNINASDSTVYTFKITRNNNEYLSGDELNYTMGSDKIQLGNDGLFTLKGGQTAYFTNLDGKNQYKIEEITNETYKKYIASTTVSVDGSAPTTGTSTTVIPNDTTKTVKFVNTWKTTSPSLTKTEDKQSACVGATVNYTITGNVPDTTLFQNYSYIIADEMDGGLTFKKDVKVTIGDTVVTSAGTITYDVDDNANKFTVAVPVNSYTVDNEIKVTYSAVVNNNSVAAIEKNSAKLTYSDDPTSNTTNTTAPISVQLYSARIVIDKYKSGEEATKLSGAEFYLYKKDGENKKYYNADGDGYVTWVDTSAYATKKTTDNNGAASFDGIADGTYYLEEVTPPAGYNMLSAPVEVTVNGTSATAADLSSLTVNQKIANNTGVELPMSGGIGRTILFTMSGMLAAIILLAAVCYFKKRRQPEEFKPRYSNIPYNRHCY